MSQWHTDTGSYTYFQLQHDGADTSADLGHDDLYTDTAHSPADDIVSDNRIIHICTC